MKLLTLENWPVLAICLGMLAAAIIDWWKFKVPNKLTYPLIFSGWLLGIANNFGLGAGFDGVGGGFGAAVMGTVLGFLLLLPIYSIGGMGAGDVKMTMGFGAWIGAFYGAQEGPWIILYAFCAGAIVGGAIALVMIALRGRYRDNAQHVREILSDVLKLKNITEASSKANARRPRWHRLPYGVPLCIGFLGYLLYAYGI
jgi:prepilin peptidase CpaA